MAKSKIPTVHLVDTRKSTIAKPHMAPVPVDGPVNNGEGVNRYLTKKHPDSGKPVFYYPERWNALSEAEKANALDHKLAPNANAKRAAVELESMFDSAGPEAQSALIDRIAERIAAKAAAEKTGKK